jgi:hypothetical protein
MNCDTARKSLPLYLYGELDFEQEEALDQHMDGCARCRQELEAERSLHQLMDRAEWAPSPDLLQSCRRELSSRIAAAPAPKYSMAARLRDALRSWLPSAALLKPAGALALLALGFFAGRAWDPVRVADPAALRVRDLTPSPSGGVQLVLEEVRERTLSGNLDEDRIRRMLLAAAADPSDPGLRARTMEVLKDRGGEAEVRRVLLRALERDSNPGVRLKALEALKPFASDPETRKVLTGVLLADDNPGVRTQAIDLLVEDMQTELIGVLQEILPRESNPYIRQKSLHALREANASAGVF